MLYITYIELYDINYTGIRKKILAQIEVLKKKYGEVLYTCYAGHMMYLMKDGCILEKELSITKEACNKTVKTWIDQHRINRVYIRYNFSDKWFLEFLKKIKEKNIKAVLEIPTYPYDGEITDKHTKLEDTYYRNQLSKYVSFIATNTDADTVWGIKCTKLVNGIDLNTNLLQKKKSESNRIVMIAVSTLMTWQGYERIIEGLYNYYKEKKKYDFLLKIIGDGPEREYYQLLISKYHVEDYVELLGKLEGEELNHQYMLADIAVSSLGRYKSGVYDFSPIKGAEYCARGIPFICGYNDIRFRGDESFIMKVPNSPEPIDMNQVIRFYEDLCRQQGYQNQMREYAVNNLSWDIVMNRIIEILQ